MLVANNDVFALKDLLSAGVVHLHLESESESVIEPAVAESDDWSSLTPFLGTHKLCVIASSQPRLRRLDFLVRNHILRATWRVIICDDVILVHVRVYLIPGDLRGAHECLIATSRNKQKPMLQGRQALISLLSDTNRSAKAWVHCPVSDDDDEPFLSRHHVSCPCFERDSLT